MSKYITMKDYEHIKENARTEAERIPSGHCRIREETEHAAIISGTKETKERKEGKASYLLLVENYNQGTTKWSHWIKSTYLVKVPDGKIVTTERKQRNGRVTRRINGYMEDKVLAIIK
nr:MAG TPA: hypothetical protein [Caudoviricetes sp.]